jgi:hypothetical protein
VDLPAEVVSLNVTGIPTSGDNKLIKTCVRLYLSLTGILFSWHIAVFHLRKLLILGSQSAADITIVVSTPSFVIPVPKTIVLEKVSGKTVSPGDGCILVSCGIILGAQTTPTMVKIYFYATQQLLPTGLTALSAWSFTTC